MPGRSVDLPKKLRPRTPRSANVDKLLAAVQRKHEALLKKQTQFEDARHALQSAVDEARAAGAVWQEIADATGLTSRQVAETRFSAAGQERNRNRAKRET